MRPSPHDGFSRAMRAVLVAAVGLGAAVVVAVWALAWPERDPVAEAWDDLVARVERLWEGARTGPPLQADPDWDALSLALHDADAERGVALIDASGCGACHTIPGISRARGTVGPPLTGFRDRAYVAGILPNRPGDLVSFLMNPARHTPQTAMPDMGLTEPQARDVAAFLYTLDGTR